MDALLHQRTERAVDLAMARDGGQALETSDWNQSKAAKKLSLGIDAFRYRMKKFGFIK